MPGQSVPYCSQPSVDRRVGFGVIDPELSGVTRLLVDLDPTAMFEQTSSPARGGCVYDDYAHEYDQTRRIPAESESAQRVDAKKLWSGGVATTIVAALVAFVGLLVARGIFGVPVLAPTEAGLIGDATTLGLCSLAALAALVGTGLMHLLLLTTPKPETFFTAIAGLATLAIALQPFTTGIELEIKIATMLVYLATGVAIIMSLTSMASYANR
ncbi:MAG: DUF6069 family protein [Pseudonocardiaceae bacterium]